MSRTVRYWQNQMQICTRFAFEVGFYLSIIKTLNSLTYFYFWHVSVSYIIFYNSAESYERLFVNKKTMIIKTRHYRTTTTFDFEGEFMSCEVCVAGENSMRLELVKTTNTMVAQTP